MMILTYIIESNITFNFFFEKKFDGIFNFFF